MRLLTRLSIRQKLWIPIVVQLLLLALMGFFYQRSSALIEHQQERSAVTANLAQALREVASSVQEYLHGAATYDQVQRNLQRAVDATQAAGESHVVERLGEIAAAVDGIQATFNDSNAIHEQILALTELSIELSDGYIRQTVQRLTDPAARSGVSDLERLVLEPAAVNSTDNLRIQLLFAAVQTDISHSTELMRFLDNGITRAATAAADLAGSPLQSMAIESGEANQQIQQLVRRHLENVEQRNAYSAAVFAISDQLLADVTELEAAQQQATFSAFAGFFATLIIFMLIATTALLLFLFSLSRSISAPLKGLATAMERLAASGGDLTFRLPAERRDEIGDVARGFNGFIAKLQEIFTDITQLVRAVDEAAASTSRSNLAVTDNAAQQKQETALVATASTEMESTIQEVTRNAAEAARNAGQADGSVREALGALDSNVASIEALATQIATTHSRVAELERDSENIGGILEVIRGVAEQTNLLALNAAIEAARAGAQGRGFAVVADEVRVLASRTQEATQQIDDMITQLQVAAREAAGAMQEGNDRTQDCVALARQAGQKLNDSAGAITEISDQNAQIASAMEEQSAVVQEIGRNVHGISNAADRTASEASAASTVAQELADHARRLATVVQQFRV